MSGVSEQDVIFIHLSQRHPPICNLLTELKHALDRKYELNKSIVPVKMHTNRMSNTADTVQHTLSSGTILTMYRPLHY
jgi:hypothetical protein